MTGLQHLLLNGIDTFFMLLEWLIFARIILSWIPIGRSTPISQLLYTLTEPILGPIRAMMDRSPLGGGMMVDFSPLIALFVMRLISMVLKGLITLL